MSVTPFSFIDYVATPAQTNFAIIRPRISDAHLRVFQNGVLLVLVTDYTISGDDVVLVVPATSGDLIRIERRTPQTERVVDFTAGGTLTEQDLDNSALQNLYLVQEALDNVLQLQYQPTVEIQWEGLPQPPVSELPDWDQNAATRRTPRGLINIISSQPWVRVDIANKEVLFAPGKYRIDVNQLFKNQEVADSLIIAGICNDQDDSGSIVHYLIVKDRPYADMGTLGGFFVFNFTVETALTFKVAVSRPGGSFNMELPRQWLVTRLGGDPALN